MKEIKNIAENIKNKIQKHEIKMKPKYYFVIGNVLAILGVIIFGVISTFSVNMIIHIVRVGKFGARLATLPFNYKIKAILIVFPWEFLLISIGFIILGVWLIRKFEEGYKNSITVLLTLFTVIVFVTAVIIDVSGLNERMGRFQIMRRIYDQRREIPNFPMHGVKGTGIQRPQNGMGRENFNFERNH